MNPKLKLLRRKLGIEALGHYAPKFSVAVELGRRKTDEYYLSLPFKRSIPAILISGAFLLAFSFPLFTIGESFLTLDDDSLFSLIFVLFSLFWMLGWSVGVGIILLVFLALSIGRETLHVSDDKLTIGIGIPGLALCASYTGELIRNLMFKDRDIEQGMRWRGSHISFDYGGSNTGFGSNIDSLQASNIILRLKGLFPMHSATPLDVAASAAQQAEADEESESMEPNIEEIAEQGNPPRWNSVSGIALILANLIPLVGVIYADWSISEIMLLFWAESAIIGYYNLCKMRKIGGWAVLFYGPFFLGHYGAFMAVHLLFIYALFGSELPGEVDATQAQVLTDLQALWPAFLALLISHGISYYTNFLKTQKYKSRKIAYQMQEPYRRIVIMHLTLIFGGFLTLGLGTGLGALLLLLGMKIVADLRGHISQHSK